MLPSYIINYNNGFTKEVTTTGLGEAKLIAEEGMTYTQTSVTIEDHEGNVLSTANWFGTPPDENVIEETIICQFGTSGYYQLWDDELEDVNL